VPGYVKPPFSVKYIYHGIVDRVGIPEWKTDPKFSRFIEDLRSDFVLNPWLVAKSFLCGKSAKVKA